MKQVKIVFDWFLGFTNKMADDHVRAYSAEASFFSVMSFLPILMLILNMIRFTSLTEEQLLMMLEKITPFAVVEILTPVLHGIYHPSKVVMPWIIISGLWTGGKFIIGISDGLNTIFSLDEEKNYLVLRVRAMIYALVMIIALIINLIILVFGYDIETLLLNRFVFLRDYAEEVTVLPTTLTMILLVLFFTMFYTFLPKKRQNPLRQIPGAVFTSVTWTIFSYLFSIYLEYAGSMSLMYGGLTTLIGVFMWLYMCMYLFFVGAELNSYLQNPDLFVIEKIEKKDKTNYSIL